MSMKRLLLIFFDLAQSSKLESMCKYELLSYC